MKNFISGFKAMLPIAPGIIPFGAIMGTVSAEAQLSLVQTVTMNWVVFAGASQLATVDLMLNNAESLVIVLTALIINMRFMLYSAAFSPLVQKSSLATKLAMAYLITDQNYAVMSSKMDLFKSRSEALIFYFGASLCMIMAWHGSVATGFIFGNFAPSSWSLDFAVPLSFLALTLPTLKNRSYYYVALFSFFTSLLLYRIPYNLGLITTSLFGLALGTYLSRKRGRS